MDKRTKKKIQALNQRIQRLRQQMAGVKKQADEPGELEALEREIADAQAQLSRLKGS